MKTNVDVMIIGAGAAGLMCAIEAGKRGRSVRLIDHAKKTAEKIRISGGGRCNFTNIHTRPEAFLSQNPHFCKSALSQYTHYDFIAMVEKHGIAYHEKTLGRLFCDDSSQQIIDMLVAECADVGITPEMETTATAITKTDDGYKVEVEGQTPVTSESLVIATGGLSIPKIGASKFGYDIAKQFGHSIIETRAGLVPLTFGQDILVLCKNLSGLSVEANITHDKTQFAEGMLFTHRGLSGPSILQISSYWRETTPIVVDLAFGIDSLEHLKSHKADRPKQDILTAVSHILPKRLAEAVCEDLDVTGTIANITDQDLERISNRIHAWQVKPSGTEGYRTAEVTLGGVNTDELSSKTMESRLSKGLFFIGEVVDVTGHLGGYNFQWAWSSGFVAGQNV